MIDHQYAEHASRCDRHCHQERHPAMPVRTISDQGLTSIESTSSD
jgi:hypothetical protein